MNKQAVKRIVLAQIASDGGKYKNKDRWATKYWNRGCFDQYYECCNEAEKYCVVLNAVPESLKEQAKKVHSYGYATKDRLIKQACEIIARHRDNDLRFFVTKDEEGIAKFIIYFDIKIDDKRYQVSFHSFGEEWKEIEKSTVPSRGHWDHKDSQETCIKLCKFL